MLLKKIEIEQKIKQLKENYHITKSVDVLINFYLLDRDCLNVETNKSRNCNCLVGFFLNNLFGVDTKMLSKVLAHWQEQAGTHIIDADQAGFIKG